MADDEQPDPASSQVMAYVLTLHRLLQLLGASLTLAAVTGAIHEGPWRAFVGGLGALTAAAATDIAALWKSPRVRQVMALHDERVNAKIVAGGNPPEPPRAA